MFPCWELNPAYVGCSLAIRTATGGVIKTASSVATSTNCFERVNMNGGVTSFILCMKHSTDRRHVVA
jgi:hypothetical protein